MNAQTEPGTAPWVAGIDLGATKIAIGLIHPDERIMASRRIATVVAEGPAAAVERIAQTILEMEQTTPGARRAAAAGICCPGPVDHVSGVLRDPPNLPGWHDAPLRAMLAQRLGRPVALEHDAKAAALGEYHCGAGRGERGMAYVVVGTGVGAAIIVEGQLYRGQNDSAGEVGHITIERNGELCSCGRRGCVETFMSGPFLAQRYQRALTADSDHQKAAALTGEQVTRLAGLGDAPAVEIMTQAGEALGVAIGTMAMLMDIDLYVIGGSVAKAGDVFLEPARRAVAAHAFQSVAVRVRIVASALGEAGPILGCGFLARQVVLE